LECIQDSLCNSLSPAKSNAGGGKLLPPGTPTQLCHNLLMKIMQEQPLINFPTLPQPLQWNAALLQHLLKQIRV
jgi:hypothetical protein